jgi:hypothetical protein
VTGINIEYSGNNDIVAAGLAGQHSYQADPDQG